jgi:hypothetical protein
MPAPAVPKKVLLILGLALAGSGAWAAAPAPGYDLDTPIQAIVADPAGAAVLNRDIPGLLSNAAYSSFKAMSLKQVGALSGGRLTHETLSRTESDLKALPRPKPRVEKISY